MKSEMEESKSDDGKDQPAVVHHYFVDEAGDPSLFNAKGKVIVGTEGCSRYFTLGKLDIAEPERLAIALDELRKNLLKDPYFEGVPSMQAAARKTATMFHAKDDASEVRREVFKVLQSFEMRFFAVVRDKQVIVRKVLEWNKSNPKYRYHPNQLYDRCVPPLFENRLHQHDSYRIVFAKRGSSDRTNAFESGLSEAKRRFREKWKVASVAPIEVIASDPVRTTCLQATDYFLWATQRCFERGEHRFVDLLQPQISLIIDRDDNRKSDAGEYYTWKNPIVNGFRGGI